MVEVAAAAAKLEAEIEELYCYGCLCLLLDLLRFCCKIVAAAEGVVVIVAAAADASMIFFLDF